MGSYIKIAINENDLAKINRGLGFAFTYVGSRERTTRAFYDYFYNINSFFIDKLSL